MRLLQHKNNEDTAIDILDKQGDKATVGIYNINYTKISGKKPFFLALYFIRLRPLNEYFIWEYKNAK